VKDGVLALPKTKISCYMEVVTRILKNMCQRPQVLWYGKYTSQTQL